MKDTSTRLCRWAMTKGYDAIASVFLFLEGLALTFLMAIPIIGGILYLSAIGTMWLAPMIIGATPSALLNSDLTRWINGPHGMKEGIVLLAAFALPMLLIPILGIREELTRERKKVLWTLGGWLIGYIAIVLPTGVIYFTVATALFAIMIMTLLEMMPKYTTRWQSWLADRSAGAANGINKRGEFFRFIPPLNWAMRLAYSILIMSCATSFRRTFLDNMSIARLKDLDNGTMSWDELLDFFGGKSRAHYLQEGWDGPFQIRVDRELKERAKKFFAVAESKGSPEELTTAKRNFWYAHDLAEAMGFQVKARIGDYAKSDEVSR